jgi:hypothetical protein
MTGTGSSFFEQITNTPKIPVITEERAYQICQLLLANGAERYVSQGRGMLKITCRVDSKWLGCTYMDSLTVLYTNSKVQSTPSLDLIYNFPSSYIFLFYFEIMELLRVTITLFLI